MAKVERHHFEAKMQGCGSDEEVFYCDGNALGCLLAFDTSGKLGDRQRQRMHEQVMEDAFNEDAPLVAIGVAPGAVNTVRQLHGTDGRERNVDLATRAPHPAQDILDTFATPLAFDQDAGIEDQAQGVSPMPMCCGVCGCG